MLQVHELTKRYGDNVVLDHISLVVNPGERVGLVGPNGCGKTTLLRCIVGEESPDAGSVSLAPPDLRVGYLEQGMEPGAHDRVADFLPGGPGVHAALSRKVARLAEAIATARPEDQDRLMMAYGVALADLERLEESGLAARSRVVLAALGLDDVPLDRPVNILSGGQKTRLNLARVILESPQLLLLDEPTNHLDIEALEWMENWLASYKGAALIVSHDRAFLDRTVTSILDLDPESHGLTAYAGNYSAYIAEWERRRSHQWVLWKDQQAEVRRIQQDIARTRNQARSVELTTTPRQPQVRRLAKKVARKARSRAKKLDRFLASEDRVEKPQLSWQLKLEFQDLAQSGEDVLALEGVAMGFGDQLLFTGTSSSVRLGERVALLGANGT